MKIRCISYRLFFFHMFSILTGTLIYLFFRNDSLLFFKWFDVFTSNPILKSVREYTLALNSFLPDWFLFSFPDGLWIFSYVCLVFLIWGNKINKNIILWILIILLLALTHEFGQLFEIFSGTFDYLDILFYVLGISIPVLFFTNIKLTLNLYKNEKLQ